MFELDDKSAEIIDEVYFWAKHIMRSWKLDFDLLELLETNQVRFKSMR